MFCPESILYPPSLPASLEGSRGCRSAHLTRNISNLHAFRLDLVLELCHVMLKFVQIVCLYLQVLIYLIRLLLHVTVLLPDLCQLDFVALGALEQFRLTLLFPPVQLLCGLLALLHERLHMIDQLFALRDHFVEHLELVTVRELKVAVDADWVDVGVCLA